jgi:hypothetical protein
VTTNAHDTPLKLCRERPEFAVDLANEILGIPIPDYDEAVSYSESATDPEVRDLNCDNVVLCTESGEARMGIIVEVQQGKDKRKRFSWPAYQVNIRHRIGAPVALVVVCPTSSVADWAAEPIETGHPGFVFQPLVLGPDNYPRLTAVTGTGELAEQMVLGTLIHSESADISRLIATTREELKALPHHQAARYARYMLGHLKEGPRSILEALMQKETYPYESKLLADREALGASEILLDVIDARGLKITENQRRKIEQCTDTSQIRAWARRAVTAPSVSDIID